jgi:hypothetical protein
MTSDPHKSLQASPEQVVYAAVLEKGMFLGLALLLLTFALYVLGIIKPYIPVSEISQYWSLSVGEYLHITKIHQGWWWVGMLGYGDFLNFVGIALLAGVTIFCFLVIIPVLWKNNDKLYALFSLLEALILGVAASGILGSGGH